MAYFSQQLLNGVVLGSALALFAVGFGLVIANMKVFNVAHEAVFAWGAVVAYFIVVDLGLPVWAAWVIAVLASGLLNVAVYFLLVRHLRSRRDQELAAFVSTMGGLAVLREVADIALHRQTVRLPEGSFPIRVWQLGGLRVSSTQLLMAAVAVVAFVVLWWVVDRTRFGREMRSVAFDRETSALLGVNTTLVTVSVFMISGAMAGLAAVPVAISYNVIDPDLGQTYMVLAMAIMVVGGFGSVIGTLVGGVLTGVIISMTSAFISNSYRDVIVFLVLIVVLIVRPSGLFRGAEGLKRA